MTRLGLMLVASLAWGDATYAQSGPAMTDEQLRQLTGNGITLGLGGPGEGYEGSLKLSKNGKGKGSAVTDGGDKISISGTWEIRDGKFCRVWATLDEGREVCETWVLTSGRSVEVFDGSRRLGVNTW